MLDDDLGSHRHCGISPTAASVRGRDEGLENGTFVGAVRVADATYSEPFGLRLGQTVLAITPLERDRREQSTTDRFGDVLCSAASACAQCQAKVDAWREEAS